MTDPTEIVRRCFQAYVDDDRAALEQLIAADFAFTSPLDNRLDRSSYFKRCWPNHETMTAISFPRLIADGSTVFANYEAKGLDGKSFRNTEILTVRGEQIIEVEVYFGWSLPHPAAPGGFVQPDDSDQGAA